jgi:CBS-domain-containing membrane protein
MTVNQREELVQVTGDLVDQRVGAFAVIDDRQHLVGMLSYVDVLSAVYRHGRGRDQPELVMAAAGKRRP